MTGAVLCALAPLLLRAVFEANAPPQELQQILDVKRQANSQAYDPDLQKKLVEEATAERNRQAMEYVYSPRPGEAGPATVAGEAPTPVDAVPETETPSVFWTLDMVPAYALLVVAAALFALGGWHRRQQDRDRLPLR